MTTYCSPSPAALRSHQKFFSPLFSNELHHPRRLLLHATWPCLTTTRLLFLYFCLLVVYQVLGMNSLVQGLNPLLVLLLGQFLIQLTNWAHIMPTLLENQLVLKLKSRIQLLEVFKILPRALLHVGITLLDENLFLADVATKYFTCGHDCHRPRHRGVIYGNLGKCFTGGDVSTFEKFQSRHMKNIMDLACNW